MITYPTKKNVYQRKRVSTTNRGMTLEALIDETNAHYLRENSAIIHKKPTPIQIVKVDYPARSMAKITEAYYKTPSTTDYNGIYKGKYIDFDVKETLSATSFPLKNIHAHQINHLKQVDAHGGIAFLLIAFKKHGTYHLLPYKNLDVYLTRAEKGRKSIAYQELCETSIEVREGFRPSLDYLKAVDRLLKQKDL